MTTSTLLSRIRDRRTRPSESDAARAADTARPRAAEKGMWSRSGSTPKRGFEGGQMPLHRRLPKRGFTNEPFKKKFSTINVSDLTKFEKGSKIGPQELVAAGVIRNLKKDGLRILGDGQIDRALSVSAHYFTESAREKITKAGGTCEVIRP